MDIRIPTARSHSAKIPVQPPYQTVLTASLTRLVDAVRDAADDQRWATTETAQLHSWMRAELLPWAADEICRLDAPARTAIDSTLTQLANLDAELLGTLSEAAATVAESIGRVGAQLIAELSSPTTIRVDPDRSPASTA